MQYQGGKARAGAHFAKALHDLHRRTRAVAYVEPFCGGLSVTARLTGKRLAADGNAALITMYRAWLGGWRPPLAVPREQWERYKATQDPNDPMTAFVGIGCSLHGRWFHSYAPTMLWGTRGKPSRRHVPSAFAAYHSIGAKLDRCRGVVFRAADYATLDYPPNVILFCDPPYAGTLGYDGCSHAFTSKAFWQWATQQTQRATVAVSECVAPDDWLPVVQYVAKANTVHNSKHRAEALFMHKSQAHLLAA